MEASDGGAVVGGEGVLGGGQCVCYETGINKEVGGKRMTE